MTLEQVDSEIAAWKNALGAAAQNLMDLHSLPTYQRLAGSNGVPKADLEGVTSARVCPALESMGTLFQNFDDLQTVVDNAAKLRKDISPIFGSDQKVHEIEALLRGKSVRLVKAPVPIEQRSLSSSLENIEMATPAELMAAMERNFSAARDVVLAVDAAWEKLGLVLDNAMTEMVAFKAEGRQWTTGFAAYAKAETSLDALRGRIEKDPLGCTAEFQASIAPLLQNARAAFAKVRTQRNEISNSLAAGRRLMAELTELHQHSMSAFTDRQLKVTCASQPVKPQDEEKIAGLREWLVRLEGKFQEGMLEPIVIGLEKWNKAADECVSTERAALYANQTPVKERNELRGRLDALKAKARAMGCSEYPDLTRLAGEATQLLFDRPTPVDKAATLVIEYERVLRAQTAAKKPEGVA